MFNCLKSLTPSKNKMILRVFFWSLHTISFVLFIEKLRYRVWKATLNKLLRLGTSSGSTSTLKCWGTWYMHSCVLVLGLELRSPCLFSKHSYTLSHLPSSDIYCVFFLTENRFVSHTLHSKHSFSSLHSSQFPLNLHANQYPLPHLFPSENNKPPRDINETPQK